MAVIRLIFVQEGSFGVGYLNLASAGVTVALHVSYNTTVCDSVRYSLSRNKFLAEFSPTLPY